MTRVTAAESAGTHSRRKLMFITLLVGGAILLCTAAAAYAAFHTWNGVYHGIGSTTGGGVGAGKPYAIADSADTYDQFRSRMYHVTDSGTLNLQCDSTLVYYYSYCEGNWGTEPCHKRAYSYAIWGGTTYLRMSNHWMRGASCPGQTHE